MRVGTAYAHAAMSARMIDAQARLYATQDMLSSGRKVSSPADDPVNSSQIVTTQAGLAAQEAYKANQNYLDGELRRLESTLGAVGDSISSARETLIAAGNAAYGDSDRRSLADKLTSERAQLLMLANTRGSDGQFLFAGHQSNLLPFYQSGSAIAYAGDNGTRGVGVGPGLTIQSNADGFRVFMGINPGNGSFTTAASATNTGSARIDSGTVATASALTGHNYQLQILPGPNYDLIDTTLGTSVASGAFTPGMSISADGMRFTVNGTPAAGDTFQINQGTTQSVFDMLDQAIAALRTPITNEADRAKVDDAVRQAAASLEQAFDNALSKRAEVGGRMNALDQAIRVSDEVAYQGKVLLGQIQDVDYAEMASKFTQQQVALQAALSAYAQTSRLSLFDYLR